MNMEISGATTAKTWHVSSGASTPMSPTQKMSGLFDQIDTTGSGAITQDQFNQAFQQLNPPASFQAAGAGAVWNKLDPNGTGSVPSSDFVAGMTSMMKELRGQAATSLTGAQALGQNARQLETLGLNDGPSSSSLAGSGSSGSIFNSVA